ncbi:DUF2855 family protein [Hoeflea sp.]|uniref:DUF2855 family protein n=1 Tax=Hoeflea sp. TaxID=1940281 RepID=UPI003B01997D
MQQFQVRKDDLSRHRLVEEETPHLEDGEVLLSVDRFALTANNVTYGVVGEKIGYWNFFPPAQNDDAGWGIIPVWGFADVTASNHPDVPVGDRLYGYFPMATHMVMKPQKVSETRLFDGAGHRAELPPVYNAYGRVHGQADYEPDYDDARMVLYPLYATSFCLHDFFTDNSWFGAEQVIVVSASSKTAIGVAYALADDPGAPESVGMTSPRNLDAVKALGLYDTVLTYDEIASVDASRPTAIIDMSGSGAVLSKLHAHLGDNMRYCSNVGVTHWDDNEMGPGFVRDRSAMFFAPGHIQKRATDWGPGAFEEKAFAFWRAAAEKSRSWLTYQAVDGLSGAESVFDGLVAGSVSPHTGLVVRLVP